MIHRPFGNLGIEVSPFGMGAMRLPMAGENVIDVDEAVRMLRYGLDNGVNYIDTAYVYHEGESEVVVEKALRDGYRQNMYIATKLPQWKVSAYEDFEKLLDESLAKLKTDYIDFYLIHALDGKRFDELNVLGVTRFLDDMVKKGKIKYPSFSFHDNYDAFVHIIDSYDWKMAQVQMNILDINNQAELRGIRYAGEKKVPIVVMEPLRGGSLATPPSDVAAIYDAFPEKRSAVDWAFRYIYNIPEVFVTLSGVSTMEQIKENVEIFKNAAPGTLSQEEIELLKKVQSAYLGRVKIGCTGCEYCMPCPSGVNIPAHFQSYDEACVLDKPERFQHRLQRLKESGADASKCVECGACEEACPQKIQIIQKLKEVSNI